MRVQFALYYVYFQFLCMKYKECPIQTIFFYKLFYNTRELTSLNYSVAAEISTVRQKLSRLVLWGASNKRAL